MLFQALVERGWLERLGTAEANAAFARSAAGCSPVMVDVAISSGLAVDPPPARRRQSSESDDDHEGSALANLASYGGNWVTEERESRRIVAGDEAAMNPPEESDTPWKSIMWFAWLSQENLTTL